jgi:3-hydroxyacyl-[acyl-carrier-protein] dehydratase
LICLAGITLTNGLFMPAAVPTLRVTASHPSLPGHFPGMPVVPGVVLLSEVLTELQRQMPEARVDGIRKLKFLKMLFPGQPFTVEFAEPNAASAGLRFKCWQAGEVLAEGNLMLRDSLLPSPSALSWSSP